MKKVESELISSLCHMCAIASTVALRLLAASLILGLAFVSQTARSQTNPPAPGSFGAWVLTNKPVAFWQLDETNNPATGTLEAYDFTGNGFNGTYGVTAANIFVSPGVLAPQPPTYLGFASNQGALLATAGDATSAVALPALNLGTNAVTILMWINPSGGQVNFTGLLMNRTPAGDAAGFGFGANPNGSGMPALGYTWNQNNGNTYNWDSGLYPVAGIWQFAALVISPNSATIYLYYLNNGEPVLQSAVNNVSNTIEAFNGGGTFLGSDVTQATPTLANLEFGGYISSAAVYNSSLTSDQILALFAAGAGVPGFAPQITTQPPSTNYVVAGSPAKISATGINGTSPIAYQWQLNDTNVNSLVDSANFIGANSNILTILSVTANDVGSYQLILTNVIGRTVSSNSTLVIQSPALVGEWLDGSAAGTNLLDVSGYSLAPNHGAFSINGGSVLFTNDAPPGKTGVSYYLPLGNQGLAISNSSTVDGVTYDNTFDDRINNAFTVACWGKGLPQGWNPFVCKWGEGIPYNTPEGGWQLRAEGGGVNPCWTVRDGQIGTFGYGCNLGDAIDDMATTLVAGNDGGWHYYAGTYNAATGVRDLYVDSVLVAQETNNVLYDLASFAHVCIGAKDSPPGSTFGSFVTNDVEIFDVCIYNYDLTQDEITTNYGVVAVVVNSQPQPVAQFTNLPAVFVAGIGGTQPVLYQWQLNGTNIQSLPDSANFTGANSATLTVLAVTPNDVGSYQLIASNVVLNVTYTVVTQPASLTIEQPALVGEWLDGSAAGTNLQDVSGYSPQGTHDGAGFGGVDNTFFTADVPPYRTGYSLGLPGGGTFSGIVISNSATGDPGYTNTYDGAISTYLTVSVWLKGSFGAYSAGWPSFFTKDEEAGGWGIRGDQWGSPGFTVRDHNAGTMFHGQNGGWDGNDDMSSLAGFDGNWHLYTGTYNSISGYRALYIDGVLSVWETGNQPYIPAPTSHVMIGAEQSNDNPLQPAFKFYDARIYNYELSAAEALALYTTLPPGTPAQIGIQPPASITTTCEGVTVQINAQSGGSPTLTNQWWFNGVKLVDGNYGGVAISGSSSDLLTIANVTTNYDGVYTLSVSNAFGGAVSSGCTLTVTALPAAAPPAGTLVGAWLTGAPTLADLSGYSPAGTHDASVQSGSTYWTNDVPPSAPAGTYSLYFSGAGLIVSNSSTLDGASYTSTYDLAISNSMTVVCWAKGYPGGWNPWVSKFGESAGWQLRIDNNSPLTPCWSVRGAGGTEDMEAPNSSNDGNWHLYAGTYDLASGVDSLYIDGVLAIQQSGLGQYTLSPPSHLMIGAKDSGGNSFGNYFTGEIYGVRIYDTALSAAQVNYFLVTPPAFVGLPAITTGPNGRQLVLSWNAGTLLQATNLTGPWTPSGATPPYTNNLTGRQMFFRLSSP